ncbi:hypothetical protein CR513_14785, partial [Mucuna pruriens]
MGSEKKHPNTCHHPIIIAFHNSFFHILPSLLCFSLIPKLSEDTIGPLTRLKRTLQDYFIPTIIVTNHTRNPLVGTNNFELKSVLISMVQNSGQFRELSTKEPLAHLKKFLYFLTQ